MNNKYFREAVLAVLWILFKNYTIKDTQSENYDEHFRCSTGVPLKWKPMEVFLISLNFVKWKLISLCLDLTLYFSGTLNKMLYHFIYQKPYNEMEYIIFFTNIYLCKKTYMGIYISSCSHDWSIFRKSLGTMKSSSIKYANIKNLYLYSIQFEKCPNE